MTAATPSTDAGERPSWTTDEAAVEPLSSTSVVAWAGAVAGIQLASFVLVPAAAEAVDGDRTTVDYCGRGVAVGLAMVLLLAIALRDEPRPARAYAVGLVPVRLSSPGWRERTRVALPVIVGLGLVALSPLAQWSIDLGWRVAPGPDWSLSTPASYRGSFPIELSAGLVAFQLLIRIPLTVLAEETFFRGYLQPRAAVAAPVVVGLLFAVSHLGQWWTIPSLVPFGIALGVLRWWLGSIWPGVLAHYAGNAAYLVAAT